MLNLWDHCNVCIKRNSREKGFCLFVVISVPELFISGIGKCTAKLGRAFFAANYVTLQPAELLSTRSNKCLYCMIFSEIDP